MRYVLALLLALVICTPALAWQSWQSSPDNWQNSPNNWQNSPNNWRNSPDNWRNNPNRWNNQRIIRDEQGRPRGYIVPKPHGGANIFDLQGNRQLYLPPQQPQGHWGERW